ncbi:MAG: hypothetical protein LRY50_04605 [Geovibrio sp.]|nr:hypothetical protein [Geovibrio sp.]
MKEIELIISSLIVIAGWIFNGWWSSKRAVQDDKRKIITSHLIDAYRILNNEVAHRKSTEERNKNMKLIGAIQLFGNEEQIELAKKLAYDIAKGGIFELDPLINSLRDSLRKSLNLKHIQGNVTWVRFNDNDVNKRNQD